MSVGQQLSLKLISCYQAATANRHRLCRFEPTCSTFATEAIDEYGFWKGWGYALRRLSRCRPGGGWGYDPVPLKDERSNGTQLDSPQLDICEPADVCEPANAILAGDAALPPEMELEESSRV